MSTILGTSIPRDGLVGEWLLDGNANDTSGNGNNGTATDVTWVKSDVGYVSQCGSFNGSSSEIDIPKETMGTISTGDFFVSGWYYLVDPGSGNYPMLFGSYITSEPYTGPTIFFDPYNVSGGGDKIIYRVTHNNELYSNITASSLYNGWHHIVLQRVGGNLQLRIDGKLDANADDNTDIPAAEEAYICRNENEQRRHGKSCLIRCSGTKALSPQEIQLLYLEGLRKLGPSLAGQYPKLFRGCIGYWDFRDGDLHNIIDGTEATNNGATTTDNHIGLPGGYYTDGADGHYIDLGGHIDGGCNTYTVGGWYKVESADKYGVLISQGTTTDKTNKFNIEVNDKVLFTVHNTDGDYYSVYDIAPDNKRHLFIGTFDGSTVKFYKDGDLVGSTSFSGTPVNTNDNCRISAYSNNDTYNIKGSFDNIILFERVLSDNEIKLLYNLTKQKIIYPTPSYDLPSLRDGLVLDLNKNCKDLSGNGNDGTPTDVTIVRQGNAYGWSFNGSSSQIKSSNIPISDYPFSFSVWVNSTGDNEVFMDLGEDGNDDKQSRLSIRDGGKPAILVRDSNGTTELTADNVINNGQWHHIVGVYTSDTLYLYVDTMLVISGDTGRGFPGGNDLFLGSNNNKGDWYTGELGIPRVYNRALSPQKIQALYYSQKGNFIL